MPRFTGKIAVVVGGNSGIGLAAAKALAAEGARVAISGRNRDTLETAAREIGPETLAYCADVSEVRQISTLFEEIRRDLSKIDVLFVNAGVGLLLPIEAVTEAHWDWVQSINLKGAFFCVQAALPLMGRGTSIVLNGSIVGLIGAATISVYAASKAGLRALGRAFAAELVQRGIRVNVVSPGPVETPLFNRVVGIRAEDVPAMRQEMIDETPMKRIGLPEEIAAAVLFLASNESSFVTGIELIVDGGAASF